MASLLIKNIPPLLHDRLKQRAAANRRSLNSETIRVLEEAVAVAPTSAETTEPPVSAHEKTWEEIYSKVPPEVAARLRALDKLRESLAARNVDFDAWMQTVRDSRR
jgi:plasmid stability protein